MQSSNWKWHLDEVFVKVNGERHYLWRAVDHEGEVNRPQFAGGSKVSMDGAYGKK